MCGVADGSDHDVLVASCIFKYLSVGDGMALLWVFLILEYQCGDWGTALIPAVPDT